MDAEKMASRVTVGVLSHVRIPLWQIRLQATKARNTGVIVQNSSAIIELSPPVGLFSCCAIGFAIRFAGTDRRRFPLPRTQSSGH